MLCASEDDAGDNTASASSWHDVDVLPHHPGHRRKNVYCQKLVQFGSRSVCNLFEFGVSAAAQSSALAGTIRLTTMECQNEDWKLDHRTALS
jgi:hypothetical protein